MKNTTPDLQELIPLVLAHGVKFLFGKTHTLISLITTDGNLIEWNNAFEYFKEDNELKNLMELVVPDNRALLQQVLQSKDTTEINKLEFLSHPGKKKLAYRAWLVPMEDGRVLFFAEPYNIENVLQEQVVSMTEELQQGKLRIQEIERILHAREVELRGVLAQVDEIAHTDPQTYLSNRKHILSHLQKEALRADRYKNDLCISMLDIDHFKNVNDQYGHAMGDRALVHLASLLNESMRGIDQIGRYGGEEFLIVLPNTEIKAASGMADRLCKLVRERPFNFSGAEIRITVSIGVAQFHPGKEDWQKFLSRADMALYDAKNAGRDGWAASA